MARSLDELEARSAELASFGVRAIPFRADLARPSEAARLIEAVEHQLGPPGILVNNAGVERMDPLDEQPDGAIERAVQVNLAAPMLLVRSVLPGMRARGRGHIVNIASMAGKIGLPNQVPYAATKAGLVMVSHTLRAELAGAPIGGLGDPGPHVLRAQHPGHAQLFKEDPSRP